MDIIDDDYLRRVVAHPVGVGVDGLRDVDVDVHRAALGRRAEVLRLDDQLHERPL